MSEAHFSRIIANSSQPSTAGCANLKRIDLHTSHNRQHRELHTPVAQADSGLFFSGFRSIKKLSVREFLAATSSLPQCTAFDSDRLTLLRATEREDEGASACFLHGDTAPAEVELNDTNVPPFKLTISADDRLLH